MLAILMTWSVLAAAPGLPSRGVSLETTGIPPEDAFECWERAGGAARLLRDASFRRVMMMMKLAASEGPARPTSVRVVQPEEGSSLESCLREAALRTSFTRSEPLLLLTTKSAAARNRSTQWRSDEVGHSIEFVRGRKYAVHFLEGSQEPSETDARTLVRFDRAGVRLLGSRAGGIDLSNVKLSVSGRLDAEERRAELGPGETFTFDHTTGLVGLAYVRTGEALVRSAERWFWVEPGDSILFQPNALGEVINRGDGKLELALFEVAARTDHGP